MLEKHLYNEEFFRFVRDITNTLQVPIMSKEDYAIGYCKNYESISQETRESC
jgi:hypothetical protein